MAKYKLNNTLSTAVSNFMRDHKIKTYTWLALYHLSEWGGFFGCIFFWLLNIQSIIYLLVGLNVHLPKLFLIMGSITYLRITFIVFGMSYVILLNLLIALNKLSLILGRPLQNTFQIPTIHQICDINADQLIDVNTLSKVRAYVFLRDRLYSILRLSRSGGVFEINEFYKDEADSSEFEELKAEALEVNKVLGARCNANNIIEEQAVSTANGIVTTP